MKGQGQHAEFALTLAVWSHSTPLMPLHSDNTHCTKLDTWYLIKWQDLALHRHSAVVEYIIFYNLKKWKTILGPHQHSYKLPNPSTRATPNAYPHKLIHIFFMKKLYQLLLVIIFISINNLLYIPSKKKKKQFIIYYINLFIF